MARQQVVPKKASNPGAAKKAPPADPKGNDKPSDRPTRRPGQSTDEGTVRPARETRPVSTRAALGFKDEE